MPRKIPSYILFILFFFQATPIFASKSRLESLNAGQTSNGSYFLDDDRNMFLNPAYLQKMNGKAIIEWGATGDGSENDTFSTPKAEGGILRNGKNESYGVYLGHEDQTVVKNRNDASTSLLRPDNTLTLIYGNNRNPDLTFGVALEFSKNQQEISPTLKKKESLFKLKGGFYFNNRIEGVVHIERDAANGALASADSYYSARILLGGSYRENNKIYYCQLQKRGADQAIGTTVSTDDSNLGMLIGAARFYQKNKNESTFYAKVELHYDRNNSKTADTTTSINILATQVGFGVEEKVTSYFTVRASIAQNILFNAKYESKTNSPDYTSSNPNTTSVATGASLVFNNYQLDGSFAVNNGTLGTNNLLSRVAINYNF